MSRYDHVLMVVAGRATDADDLRGLLGVLGVLPAPARTPATPRKEHGTESAYKRHLARGEEPCEECRAAVRAVWKERSRIARRAKAARPMVLAPCGTQAAYQRHLRHGETPCRACRAANSAHSREYKQQRRAVSGGVR